MRVLLIGPLYGNAQHGAEVGIYHALHDLGYGAVAYDYRERLYEDPRNDQPARIEIEDFLPPVDEYDVILCPGPGLPERVIPLLSRLKGKKVLWNSEPIRLRVYRDKVASQKELFSHIFSFDESELPLYREIGVEAQWLPQAFHPGWYKLRGPRIAEIEMQLPPWDLVFVGSIGGKWGNRQHFLQRIAKQFSSLHVTTCFDAEKVCLLYQEAKLVLNLGLYCPQSGDPALLRSFGLQQRIFESIGAGKVCVTNRIPAGTNEIFWNRENILFYDSKNIEEVIEFGLDDANRSRMESDVRAIRSDHTYSARLKQMMEMIQ